MTWTVEDLEDNGNHRMARKRLIAVHPECDFPGFPQNKSTYFCFSKAEGRLQRRIPASGSGETGSGTTRGEAAREGQPQQPYSEVLAQVRVSPFSGTIKAMPQERTTASGEPSCCSTAVTKGIETLSTGQDPREPSSRGDIASQVPLASVSSVALPVPMLTKSTKMDNPIQCLQLPIPSDEGIE